MDSLRNNYTFCHNRNNFFRMSVEIIKNCVMQADTTASSSFHALKKFGFWPCVYWNNRKVLIAKKNTHKKPHKKQQLHGKFK